MTKFEQWKQEEEATSIAYFVKAITITEAALSNPSQFTSILPAKKQYSPNANHEKQLRFYPTKRKREKSKQICIKPTF